MSARGAARFVARLALVMLAIVAGCATSGGERAGPLGPDDIVTRDQRLAELVRFSVGGGFGYWDDEQNLTAAIAWQRDADVLKVRLRGPFGIGRLDIEQVAAGARVSRDGRAPLTGATAAPLLGEALGLAAPVPLDQLGEWIRGLPGEDATDIGRDEAGRLRTLVYRDAAGARWRASVRRYRQVNGWWLPALLTAVSGERHLRLSLSDWQVPPRGDTDGGSPPADTPTGTPAMDGPEVNEPAPDAPAGRRLSLPGA